MTIGTLDPCTWAKTIPTYTVIKHSEFFFFNKPNMTIIYIICI